MPTTSSAHPFRASRPRHVLVILAVLTAASPGQAPSAAGQAPTPIPGDTIRVTTDGRNAVYEVTAVSKDSLVVRREGGTVTIPTRTIQRLELRMPGSRTRQAASHAFIGGLAGGAGGFVAGLAEGDDPADCWFFCMSAGEKAALYGLTLGSLGAGVGAIIGALRPVHPRWSRVPLDAFALGVIPAGRGAAVVLRWRP